MKRINIMPIICYVILLVISGFLLYFFGTYFNLIFLAALIILPLSSYVNGFLSAQFTKVSITGAAFVENRNDEFVFNVNVKNNSVFISNKCVSEIIISNSLQNESTVHSLTLPSTPFSQVSVSYPVRSSHCGIVKIEINKIRIYDLLNVFSFSKEVNIIHEIPVFPNGNVVGEEFSMDFTKGYSEMNESSSKGYDFSEVSDVREYIPGDKLQDIHWKLSAKKDIMMVKEHVSLASKQLVFYVELAGGSDNVLDEIMDYAYGIGTFLCENTVPFTYIWYSTHFGECKMKCMQSKAELRDVIYEMLYETPIADYREIRSKIKQMSGHENFITIGTDYVLESKKDREA